MNLARRMEPPVGELAAVLIPKHGFYAKGLPKDLPLKYRVRTHLKEAALHARLAGKGFWRGAVHGSGVIGVGRLYASVRRADGRIEHLGLISTKLITDAAVAYLVDDWDGGANTVDLWNFHGCGTTNTAEAVGDTALAAESTAILNPGSTRATGTKSQPAANQMRSVGTLTFQGAGGAIVEHGLFTTSGTGTGSLFDRSIFAAINVASGDSIQFTYTATWSSGG